jgi:hypothetical protein
MQIKFDDEATSQGSLLHIYATVDGRRVECRAGIDTITELGDHADQSGTRIGKDKASVSRALQPYFKRKIENGSFDDEERTNVTLLVHELVSFMQEGRRAAAASFEAR